MARRKYAMTENKVQRFYKERRGKGEGVNYKPWLTVFDFPSKGKIHRFYGLTVPREYHLFSDGEYECMTQYDWDPRVTDIREQFPLDRELTRKIAHHIKEIHPRTMSGTEYVFTTDFLLVFESCGQRRLLARTVKPEEELIDKNVRVKFEIERRYWAYHNVDWSIVTERHRNPDLVRNISSLRSFQNLTGVWTPYPGCFRDLASEFARRLQFMTGTSLRNCCVGLADKFGVSPELVFTTVRHLLVRKLIKTDMRNPMPFADRRLEEFVLNVSMDYLNAITV